MTLETVVEHSGASGDYLSWAIGQETSDTTFTLDFWLRLSDRDYRNQPSVGATSDGVIVAHAQSGGSQIGWQIDAGAEEGTLRFILINGTDTNLVWRWVMPAPGWTHVLLTYNYNSGTPLFGVYHHKIAQKLTGGGSFASGAPSSGLTAITFFSRAGSDALSAGCAIAGPVRFWNSVLSATEIANAYASGRAQNYNVSGVTSPTSLVLMGSGVGDTATLFQDQTANNHDISLVGAWATLGMTYWDPARLVGEWVNLVGTENTTTQWSAGAPSGRTPNFSVSNIGTGLRITGSPTGGEEFQDYVKFGTIEYSARQAVYARVQLNTDTEIFGFGCVPARQASGGEAQALACIVNLINGIISIHTGEYNTGFDSYSLRVRSDTLPGTVPVSGGGTVMPGTPAANDIYELFYQLDGHTITFWVRNETQDLAPCRVQHFVTNETADGLTDLAPQSGYPAFFKLLSGTMDILEFRHIDLTTYQPYLAVVCDSLMSVDQDLYTDNAVGETNKLLEASSNPARWMVHFGRPGDRIQDAQAVLDAGHAARVNAQNWVLELGFNTFASGAVSLTAAEAELQALQDDLFAIAGTQLVIIPALVPESFTNGPSSNWHPHQSDVADSSPNSYYYVDTFDDLGTTPGSDTQNASYFDADGTHMNDAGAAVWAAALFSRVDTLPAISITIADCLHAHAADNITVSIEVTLTPGDTSHAHAVDAVDLVQAGTLSVADSAHANTTDNVDLVQAGTLAVADALHDHLVDSVALTQQNTLAPADALHAQAADNVDLTQQGTLVIADTNHDHAVDNVALTQANLLAVADSLHVQSTDGVVLELAGVLIVQDGLHAHLVDGVELTQANTIALEDTLHAHAADEITLLEGFALLVADTAHDHTADAPTLTQAHLLAIQDALHGHTADLIALIAAGTLTVSDTVHVTYADNITMGGGVFQIGNRLMVVLGRDRVAVVAPT